MATPYFFLSYAAENDDEQLRRFFNELNSDVANLPGGPLARAGFIDSAQRRGAEWDRNLQDALATTRVMVCVYSPIYFQKPYCGMEVEVMLRRRRRYQDQKKNTQPSNIIPVLWFPVENLANGQTTIARTLPKFFVSRDKQSIYEHEGLKYMMETAAYQDAYVALRRSIAKDIVIAASRFELEHEPRPFTLAALPNAFVPKPLTLDPRSLDRATFGPKSTTCVYVGRRGWHIDQAVPFRPPPEDGVPYICAAVAGRLESSAYEMTIDPASGSGFDILQHIARNNGRMVVVVDGSAMAADPFSTWLRTFDEWLCAEEEPRLANCATIVLGAEGEPRAADFLPLAASDPHLVFHAPSTADALDFAVEKSLGLLHDGIAARSKSDAIERETQHRTLPGFGTQNAA